MEHRTSENVSSADNQQERLQEINPWYISGFVDGEGSFHISISRKADLPLGWVIIPEFHVSQDVGRSSILYELQNYFNCGIVKANHKRKLNDSTKVLVVRNRSDLIKKIIPFFAKYPMRSSKQSDYLMFAEIVQMMLRHEHLTLSGFEEIVKKSFQMNGNGKYRKRNIQEILEESSETVRQIR